MNFHVFFFFRLQNSSIFTDIEINKNAGKYCYAIKKENCRIFVEIETLSVFYVIKTGEIDKYSLIN